MTEAQARAAAVILSAILTAGSLWFAREARKLMRESVDQQGRFYRAMVERQDHAMWSAEIDAAGDAPGEAI